MDEIVKCLGTPYFKTKDFVLYNIDCIEGMEKLSNSKIKIVLTVTSPPYNIGKEYEENKEINEYVSWCEKWMKLIYKITSDNGSFWLNLGYTKVEKKGRCVPISYLLWDKTDFFLNQEIVWHYGAGVSCKNYMSPRNEKFLWFLKDSEDYIFNLNEIRDKNVKYPNQKKDGKLRCNPLGKNPTDVWDIPKVTSGKDRSSKERTDHPAQFPLEVIERIIKGSSNEGDLILDPFMGSGTVAESCLSNNRIVIGFEINEDYCKIIKKRINNMQKKITPKRKVKEEEKEEEEDITEDIAERKKKKFSVKN